MSPVYHESTLHDLIKKEDELIRQREKIDNELICALYAEEEAMDYTMREIAKGKVNSLRSEKEVANQQIEEVRTDIKRKLLRLFE